MKASLIPLVLAATISVHAHAGLGDAMESFFNQSGLNSNVTSPSAYQGQSANHYNAGSLFSRTRVQNIQLAAITMPSVSAGCGGIDAFMGGFSHINSDQLVEFGNAVIANAVPFAVNLALQVWAPTISNVKENLQAISDEFLTTSMNSCQVAQSAVSGLAAFAGGEAKRHSCATLGTQSNRFSDWLQAQHECSDVSTNQSTLAHGDEVTKHAAKVNLNVMWEGLMKSSYLASNKPLAEFLLTLTGTVIYDATGTPHYKPSLLTGNDTAINVLLTGGTFDAYRCNDPDTCLSVTIASTTLDTSQAFNTNVRETIEALYTQLHSDQAITDAQKGFIEQSTTIPILSVLIDDAHMSLTPPFDLYSKHIAADLLHAYLTDMMRLASQSMTNLSAVNPDDVAHTLASLRDARAYLQTLRDANKRKLAEHLLLAEQLKRKRTLLTESASADTLANLSFGH